MCSDDSRQMVPNATTAIRYPGLTRQLGFIRQVAVKSNDTAEEPSKVIGWDNTEVIPVISITSITTTTNDTGRDSRLLLRNEQWLLEMRCDESRNSELAMKAAIPSVEIEK